MNYIENKKSNIRRFAAPVIVIVLMGVSFAGGIYLAGKNEVVKDLAKEEVIYLGTVFGKYSKPEAGKIAQDIDFNLFWDVWDTLKKEYVDREKLTDKEMFYGALRGIVESVEDPYTVFMDPKESKEFEESLTGTFEGIGAEIGIRDEILTIIAPLTGMPAEIAGLRSGDKVYSINEESTMGITIEEAVRKIRGPKGTDVTLTIVRNGIETAEDITITRGTIIVKSVRTEVREGAGGGQSDSSMRDDIYIVEITNFNNDTLSLFNDAISDIIKVNPSGIIIDLRNNPGGYLDTAIEVSSEWVEDGIVVTEEFNEESKNEFFARGRARLKDYKTVVLVNQGSASASEIVAGALQDYGLATIVGMQTFGKGSVQTLEDFKDGSSVKITVAKWLTPNGNYINEEGITPDEIVEMTFEDYENKKDPQMDRAVEILKMNNE